MIKTKQKNNSHHKIEQNTKTIVELTLFQRDTFKIRIRYEISGVNTILPRAYCRETTKTKR